MKITPLVKVAGQRIPALVPFFSDQLVVSTMAVVAGGQVTITTPQPHGLAPVGGMATLSITDALTPNPIATWQLLSPISAPLAPTSQPPGSTPVARSGDVLITTTNPTGLTFTPDLTRFDPWTIFAMLSGTGTPLLDGSVQIVDTPNPTMFIVRPTFPLSGLPINPPSGAALLERLDLQLIGWQAVTATDTNTLVFPTPASVQSSFQVVNPKVAVNVRALGAVDLAHAMGQFTRPNDQAPTPLDQAWLFVTPPPMARLSRDRNTRTDAQVEWTPQSDIRGTLIDGFEIYVVLPAERYGGAVGCMDKCQGPIFTAMMLTFNGIRVPRSELFIKGTDYVASLSQHGCAHYDKANYIHRYAFELIAQITNQDAVRPDQIPDVTAIDLAIQNGNPPPDTVLPVGSTPLAEISLDGIYQQGEPQPLVAHVVYPDTASNAAT